MTIYLLWESNPEKGWEQETASITPNDPATFVTVTLLRGAAGVGASWIPARRAARLDPARTLRAE